MRCHLPIGLCDTTHVIQVLETQYIRISVLMLYFLHDLSRTGSQITAKNSTELEEGWHVR